MMSHDEWECEKHGDFIKHFEDCLVIADLSKVLFPSSFQDAMRDTPMREDQIEILGRYAKDAKDAHEYLAKARKWLKKAHKLEKKHRRLAGEGT